MPLVLTAQVHSRQGRRIRLWIPLPAVLALLSPLTPLVAVVLVVACLANRINPVRALGSGWRVLRSLSGTRIEIEQRRTAVLVNLT